MEGYLAIKRTDMLTHATTRMNLGNLALTERSQAQKTTLHLIPFTENLQDRQIQRNRRSVSGWSGLGAWEGGNGE